MINEIKNDLFCLTKEILMTALGCKRSQDIYSCTVQVLTFFVSRSTSCLK